MLANIHQFVYTPQSPIQIILGTNGSGKSSVLYELSPLPAQSGQYSRDGYKKIWITHKGSQYVLESTFKHGNKHSFKKDGEELNPGGTGMVQKELVRQHFQYTQELHELLIGETRFTQMAPMRRREWITQLDSQDYTFALGVYQKLRTLARDYQGTLKHLKQRLTTETNNLRLLEGLTGMEERAQRLHAELNALLREQLPNLPTLEQIQSRVHSLIQRIEHLSDSVLKVRIEQPSGKQYRNLEEVGSDLAEIEGNIQVSKSLLDRSTNEYSELQTVTAEFSQDGDLDLTRVDEYLQECDRDIEQWRSQVELFHELIDPELIQRDNEVMLDLLVQLFSQLPDNQDRRYSREAAEQARQRIRQQEDRINRATIKLNQIRQRIETIRSAKDTVCPQCKYVWREGFSESELAQNEQWYAEYEKLIEEAEKAIAQDNEFLQDYDHYAALYAQFRGYVHNYPRLKPLWDYILQNKLLFDSPSKQTGLFLTWRRDVERHVKIAEVVRKREHLVELAERHRRLGDTHHLGKRMKRLYEEIETLTMEIGRLQEQGRHVGRFRDRMLRVQEAASQLEAVLRDLEKSRDIWIDVIRNQHIDRVIHQHQLELANIQHRLTEKRTLEGVVADLTKSHASVELDYQVYSLLTRAISPDEGLIAEQLSGFIGCLVAQMNAIIASVWTYDMTVLPCGIESGDLDYKFPMQIVAGDREIPDVGKGSKGQQAMVDFAFQLTVMLYMGLEDYPLYLDEPGEGFDEQHRIKLMNFIKQLMDSGRYSQLFMISHFATSHGAFLNAEVLVLDPTNIAVPSGYNQHVLLA